TATIDVEPNYYAQDDRFDVTVGSTLYGNVLDNDSLPPGDAVVSFDRGNLSGTDIQLNSDGSFSYTPNLYARGSGFSFGYTVQVGDDTYSASVYLGIDVVKPSPAADTYQTPLNTQLIVSAPGVLANDTPGDGGQLYAFLQQNPAHGTLYFDGSIQGGMY